MSIWVKNMHFSRKKKIKFLKFSEKKTVKKLLSDFFVFGIFVQKYPQKNIFRENFQKKNAKANKSSPKSFLKKITHMSFPNWYVRFHVLHK